MDSVADRELNLMPDHLVRGSGDYGFNCGVNNSAAASYILWRQGQHYSTQGNKTGAASSLAKAILYAMRASENP